MGRQVESRRTQHIGGHPATTGQKGSAPARGATQSGKLHLQILHPNPHRQDTPLWHLIDGRLDFKRLLKIRRDTPTLPTYLSSSRYMCLCDIAVGNTCTVTF